MHFGMSEIRPFIEISLVKELLNQRTMKMYSNVEEHGNILFRNALNNEIGDKPYISGHHVIEVHHTDWDRLTGPSQIELYNAGNPWWIE